MLYILFLLALILTFILWCSIRVGSIYDSEIESCQEKRKEKDLN